jgi:hypothetical protein
MNRSSGKRACGNRKKKGLNGSPRDQGKRARTTHQKKGKNGSPIERKDQGNEDATQ